MRRNFSAEGWDEVVFSYEGRSPSRSHVKTQKHVARRGGLGRPLRLIPAVAGGALIALAILNFYYAPKGLETSRGTAKLLESEDNEVTRDPDPAVLPSNGACLSSSATRTLQSTKPEDPLLVFDDKTEEEEEEEEETKCAANIYSTYQMNANMDFERT
eukprot:1631616-Pyramimonas_sp.AAC.2